MRKYYLLIVLCLTIVIVFTTFYIKSLSVSNHYPTYTFETIEGDETVIKDFVIRGDLHLGHLHMEPFQVDHEGTTYLRDEPFLKRINTASYDLEMDRLQKEYRSFMRGKERSTAFFFESEEVLAYAATPYDLFDYENYEFEVAVLDKETNETTTFFVPIPDRKDFWYVDVRGVHVMENELSIVSLNDRETDDGDSRTEIHIYTFDIEKKELIKEEVTTELTSVYPENGYSTVNVLMNEQSDGESIILYQVKVEYTESEEEMEVGEERITIVSLLKYNLKTGKIEEMSLPEKENIGVPIAFDGETLHFAGMEKGGISFTNYSTANKTFSAPLTIATNIDYYHIDELTQALVRDNKLYFMPSFMEEINKHSLFVIDLEKLTKEYEGIIENKNPSFTNSNASVYFHTYMIRDR